MERIDRTRRINGAFRQLKIDQVSEKIRQEPKLLPQGPFRIGVIDPPWLYQDESYSLSREGVVPYPVTSVEEIMATPVTSIMHPDSLLWMWTTNRHLSGVRRVRSSEYWGFRPVSLLTRGPRNGRGRECGCGVRPNTLYLPFEVSQSSP